MENEVIDLEAHNKLEISIIKIITKIISSRSRPCYQNILTHLNKGEYKDLQMDDLKSVLEGMIEKNGEQNESFYVIEETNVLEHDENIASTKSLESFINDEFYSVKQNQIGSKLGCRKCIESKYITSHK